MKKFTLIWLFVFALILSGCGNRKVENIGNNSCNGDKKQCIENYSCNDGNECISEIDLLTYEWELVVQWVWPEISMEPTLEEWILALRWNFEDHTDHVYLRPWIWENYFQSENEYLPGNTVKLVWKVQTLDWAAGNHYYVVEKVEKLEFVNYPTEDEIKELLESYNYCEMDDDCAYIAWECPFGCFVPLNNSFIDIAWNILGNYFDVNGKNCVYSCLYIDKVVCENYKCINTSDEENLVD